MRILSLLALPLACAIASPAAAQVERHLDRTFKVSSDSTVAIRLAGGSITTVTGGSGSVEVRVTQVVRNARTERDADDILARYDVSATQSGGDVSVVGTRRNDSWWSRGSGRDRVEIRALVTVPANVRLALDTSGGSITVRGERSAPLEADTSGGTITVDGGRGAMDLDTSGGGIRVTQAFDSLRASTSGGSITVGYVGPSAQDVSLNTSGGSITVGVDRDARLDLTAQTSGGGVDITGLNFSSDGRPLRRSHVSGTLNGGGGRLSADTSGGSIHIRAAARP